MRAVCWLVVASSCATIAKAESHSYVNSMRSDLKSSVFIQQSVDGEVGHFSTLGQRVDKTTGLAEEVSENQRWQGYSIGTTVGVELMKFVHFTTGHSLITMRFKEDALESLIGSRVHAGLRSVFLSPIANLELGMGVQGSRLDYQNNEETSTLVGNGYYHSLGLNHFLSSRFSCYTEAKLTRDHLVRNNGSMRVVSVHTNTTIMGVGFRLWL